MLINLPEIMEFKKDATGIDTQVHQLTNPMLFTQCCLNVVNLCFQIVVLEKTLESPLDSKEIKPVNLKENQPVHSKGNQP